MVPTSEDSSPTDIDLMRMRFQAPGEYFAHEVGEENLRRLNAALGNSVPVDSLVVGARWWQLETYLRQLLYIELRALRGPGWAEPLRDLPVNRMAQAQEISYMASADDSHVLMYTDVSRLFDLVEHYWKECRHGIGMPLDVWKGRRYELEQIRHRKAHCRRPHRDDVDRIEQTLRDLEPAASKTLRLYVDWTEVNPDLDDPVVRDWIGRDHEKSHLVEHGFKNKGIDFHLAVSARPWADREATIVSGTPGYWWVLWVVLHDQHMFIDDFVRESAVRSSLPLIGHIIQPSDHFLYVTFPSVGNATDISDAIARCFEAVFYATTYGVNDRPGVRHPWRRAELDPRVDAQGLLSVLSDLNLDDPISIFSSEKP